MCRRTWSAICVKMMAKKPDRSLPDGRGGRRRAGRLAGGAWARQWPGRQRVVAGGRARRRASGLPVARREPAGKAARRRHAGQARPGYLPDRHHRRPRPVDRQGAAADPGPRPRQRAVPVPRSAARSARPSNCPVAQPLENGPASEFVDSHRRSALRSRPHSPAPAVTDEQMAAYRRRRKSPVPGWVWLVFWRRGPRGRRPVIVLMGGDPRGPCPPYFRSEICSFSGGSTAFRLPLRNPSRSSDTYLKPSDFRCSTTSRRNVRVGEPRRSGRRRPRSAPCRPCDSGPEAAESPGRAETARPGRSSPAARA